MLAARKTNPIFKIRLERELNSSDGLYLSNIYKIFHRLSQDDVDEIIDELKKDDKINITYYKNDKLITLKG